MNEDQKYFLIQYMDDYQIKKFEHLIENGNLTSFADFLKKKQTFKNISYLEKEYIKFKENLKNYKRLSEINKVKELQKNIEIKKIKLKKVFDFSKENTAKIDSEYEKHLNLYNKNQYINNDDLEIEKLINIKNKKLNKWFDIHKSILKKLYYFTFIIIVIRFIYIFI